MKKILFFFFLAGIISSKAVLLRASEPAENKLMQVEGVFITDIFSDSMENRINEAVLNRLDGEILSILNASKIWLHFDSHYNQKGIDFADEIFKKRDSLILAGADLSKNSGGIMGIFFSCLFRDLKQGANAAFANSFGGGLYAMKEVLIDRNSVFLKGNASFSIQNYESERNYIDTPYGFFNLKSPMKTSLFQGAFYADYFYSAKTKFFTGADLSILTNENTQEKISNSGQIEIDGISNIRISALLGFESGKKYENTDLDFGFYLRRAVYGEQAEVAVHFDASKSKIQLLSGAEGLESVFSAGLKHHFSEKIFIRYRNDLSFGYKSFGYGFLIEANFEFGKSGLALKDIEKKFQEAQEAFAKREYLKATDMISEILKYQKQHLASLDLQTQIDKKIAENFSEISKSKIEDNIYAKGYRAYYSADWKAALSEWYRYLQYNQNNTEINEYYNRVQKIVRQKEEEEERRSGTAKAQRKAEEILQDGIKKFDNKLWSKCIKTMEKLLSFTVENKIENTQFYRQKAQHYISESLKQILPASNSPQSDSAPIDEQGAENSYSEGLSLYSQGRYIEAQRAWELTLRLNPNHKKAVSALSNLKKSGQISE